MSMAKVLPIHGFVVFLKQQHAEGAGYIMGSYGQNPRTGYLDLNETKVKSAWKTTGWYYTQYSGSQKAQALKWREKCNRVFDCQGLSEGYYEIMTGTCVNTYARNNYATWCNPKGSGMIPVDKRVPGAAVFWGNTAGSIHHIGYLVEPVEAGKPEGDWWIIEARGVMYGVVKTKLYSRKPNFWGWMTLYYDYDNADTSTDTSVRDLKNGCEGEDVKALQLQLLELGYDLGKYGADGDFGDCTELAVKAFQDEHMITADGIVGEKTRSAIAEAIATVTQPVEEPTRVMIEGGNCYVRSAPNTSGSILGVVTKGTSLPFGGTINEDTQWLSVEYKGGGGWVSNKYGRLTL